MRVLDGVAVQRRAGAATAANQSNAFASASGSVSVSASNFVPGGSGGDVDVDALFAAEEASVLDEMAAMGLMGAADMTEAQVCGGRV